MSFTRLLKIVSFLVPLTAASVSAPASAAGYPERPVTIIVPFAPGGPTDALARIIGQSLQKQSGSAFIIENSAGAGTTIGATKAARSKADGYTLFWGSSSSLAIAPHLYQLPFDPLKSFDPISWIASTPYVLVVKPSLQAKTLADLVTQAKAAPGKLNYASPGAGSGPHVVTELFLTLNKIDVTHIPFKGGSSAITALMAGDIDFEFDTPTVTVPLIKSGKVRALAVANDQRLLELPDVPTIKETGLPSFEGYAWFALFAPSGTPPEIVTSLNKMIAVALADDSVQFVLKQAGYNGKASSPAELARTLKAEHEKWGKVIRDKGIKLN